MAIINGNDLNNILFGTAADDTINGLGGHDTINGAGGNDTISAGLGNDFVLGDAGDDIVTGGLGDDFIFGGDGNDQLYGDEAIGGTGNDVLDGGAGNDIIFGGEGDDTVYANSGADLADGGIGNDIYFLHGDGFAGSVTIQDGSGIDTLNFSLAAVGVTGLMAGGQSLSADGRTIALAGGLGTSQIENFIGSDHADAVTGNELANRMEGGGGNDRLFGFTGGDTMIADAGEDYLSGGSPTTRTTFTSGAPNLSQPVEAVRVIGETMDAFGTQLLATGGATARIRVEMDLFIDGGGLTEVRTDFSLLLTVGGETGFFIVENSGNDSPVFQVTDTVTGTPGADSRVTRTLDLIVLGLNVFLSPIQVQIQATNFLDGANSGSTSETVSFGQINGNGIFSGDDTLDGGANGAGRSTLYGADGNDTYIIRDLADIVQENAGDGTDTVQSEISYALPFAVENLTLLTSADIDGFGNSLVNTLIGNSGNNFLDGAGGADTMNGGAGNDTYIVRDAGDTVVEAAGAGGGIDLVQSLLANYTLANNVENGELGATNGTNLTGNALDNILTGNGGNNSLNGGLGNDTMRGGFGNDTYTVSQAGDLVVENILSGNDTVFSQLADYTLTANVENLTLLAGANNGTGNFLDNVITGNSAVNTLIGGLGNDTLNGGAGLDTLNGGAGNDIYIVDSSNETIIDASGIDTVQTAIQLIGPLFAPIENLMLTGAAAINGAGNTLNNRIIGNSAINTLLGGDGNDVVEGGSGNDILDGDAGNDRLDGGLGNDTMTGGVGNDTFVVNSTGDVVNELAGGGTADTIESFISIVALAAEVENLTLLGGSSLFGTGNALVNRITGNSGDNILDGAGGADIMNGGAGNDVYRIDVAGEIITELAGEGTADRVESLVSYALTANVENLTLLGVDNINGMGNALANVIRGNSGNNLLNGAAGGDTMIGGNGNDVYVVDDAGDAVFEVSATGGVDLVQSFVTFTLGSHVENLTLTGLTAINGTGNTLANVITGNTANNILDGGLGADTMNGGAGNDTYIVDNALDIVNDSSGTADEVRSTVTRTLEAAIENLTLTGNAAINGTGNALANTIVGNGAANTLDGKLGADVLTGGGGADRFQFTTLQNLADTITDFTVPEDKIVISATAFGGGLVAGAAVQLTYGNGIPAPSGTGGQFLFDDFTENLYFDQNGINAGGLFHIAVVQGGGNIIVADSFIVIA